MVTLGNDKAVLADVRDFELRAIPLPELQAPRAGEVHLWFLDLASLAGSLRHALDGHSEGEVILTTGQLRFARRFYLRLLLGAYLGLPGKEVRLNRKQRGKPVLDASIHGDDLHFSMAKSEGRVLIGFSTSSHIGVDLEPVGRKARDALGVARRYFSPAEADFLAATPADQRDAAFLRIWACKEAVVKASGMGIANQFAHFTVNATAENPTELLDHDGVPIAHWALALVQPEDGFLGAVAIQDSVTRFRAHRLIAAP